MPLTKKGEKILAGMQKEYGEKKGKEVFYASKNAGTIKGVDDIEFVAQPPPALEDDVMQRVQNMLDALKGVDKTATDDRSSEGHTKEAERLEREAKAAEASGNEKVAEALRAKAETHKEEIGRKDQIVKSPISSSNKSQPPCPPTHGRSPISKDSMVR